MWVSVEFLSTKKNNSKNAFDKLFNFKNNHPRSKNSNYYLKQNCNFEHSTWNCFKHWKACSKMKHRKFYIHAMLSSVKSFNSFSINCDKWLHEDARPFIVYYVGAIRMNNGGTFVLDIALCGRELFFTHGKLPFNATMLGCY